MFFNSQNKRNRETAAQLLFFKTDYKELQRLQRFSSASSSADSPLSITISLQISTLLKKDSITSDFQGSIWKIFN